MNAALGALEQRDAVLDHRERGRDVAASEMDSDELPPPFELKEEQSPVFRVGDHSFAPVEGLLERAPLDEHVGEQRLHEDPQAQLADLLDLDQRRARLSLRFLEAAEALEGPVA